LSKKAKPDDPEQMKRFEQMAIEVEADKSEDALEKAMAKIALKPLPSGHKTK
jgi:hypothetical protein